LRLLVDGAVLAGMAVSQGRSVERSRLAWLSTRLPPLVGWLTNDVPAGRGFAVAWLKRGTSAMEVSGIRRARHGLLPASMERGVFRWRQ
jgi:hypothetical protein